MYPFDKSDVLRRDILRFAAAGVVAISPSGWLLPRLALASEKKLDRTKSCIMLHMQGGVSQHHTFTVPEHKAQNQQIATSVPGVLFCELFPQLAACMDDICLIRGMSTGNSVHERARILMHTGYNQTLGAGHYANAWTTWLAGGGVQGGLVIGRVDAKGGEVTDRPVNAQDFLATICHALQIDYHREYMSKEGRPMTFLTSNAMPVMEVF